MNAWKVRRSRELLQNRKVAEYLQFFTELSLQIVSAGDVINEIQMSPDREGCWRVFSGSVFVFVEFFSSQFAKCSFNAAAIQKGSAHFLTAHQIQECRIEVAVDGWEVRSTVLDVGRLATVALVAEGPTGTEFCESAKRLRGVARQERGDQQTGFWFWKWILTVFARCSVEFKDLLCELLIVNLLHCSNPSDFPHESREFCWFQSVAVHFYYLQTKIRKIH